MGFSFNLCKSEKSVDIKILPARSIRKISKHKQRMFSVVDGIGVGEYNFAIRHDPLELLAPLSFPTNFNDGILLKAIVDKKVRCFFSTGAFEIEKKGSAC